jgi:adenosylcobyric acid synthase
MIVEGAGSPAETNLRANDIANMGFAHAVDLPVVLVGDIERGHVIASLVGAHAVLDDADRARVRGFVINKFRGDASLFTEGLATIEARTGWPSLGVVPWMHATLRLPAEDGMQIGRLSNERRALGPIQAADTATSSPTARAKIALLHLPHIANFDDFEPLAHEPNVQLVLVKAGEPIPLDAQLVIIPGSKTTIPDLQHLRAQGWDHDLHAYVRRGGRVLGICAGYQMLGNVVRDPMGIEGSTPVAAGLGLLDIETTMGAHKTLRQITGSETSTGAQIDGYEMHLGISTGHATRRPMMRFEDGSLDGAMSANGRVAGCHIHGLFNSPAYRSALLASLGTQSSGKDHLASVNDALDELATALESTLNIETMLKVAQ